MMKEMMQEYFALSPLDGRYSKIGKTLSPYFSEYALVKNRVKVEVYWLQFLLKNIKNSHLIFQDIKDQRRLLFQQFQEMQLEKLKNQN